MAEEFADRIEEVLGLLHGMAWPLLEEAEKKKVVAKVARGVDRFGDTVAAWARALGVADRTLRDRLDRFRRSEPVDGLRGRDHNTTGRALRGARQVLRDPKLVAELMEDPATRRSIAKAAVEHQADVEATERQTQRQRAPGVVHRSGFNEVAGDLLRARHLYAKALEAARRLDLDAGEADALMDDVTKIAQITGWFESWLSSGADDFDTELERILEG